MEPTEQGTATMHAAMYVRVVCTFIQDTHDQITKVNLLKDQTRSAEGKFRSFKNVLQYCLSLKFAIAPTIVSISHLSGIGMLPVDTYINCTNPFSSLEH